MPPQKAEPKLYCDLRRGNYLFPCGDKFIPLPASSCKRQLQMQGIPVDDQGPNGLRIWERALSAAEMERNVDYAGPLAGYQAGPLEVSGGKILVTTGFKMVEADSKVEADWLEKFTAQLLGDAQLRYFMLWLKFARETLREGSFRPGHFVAFCGPTACGKSLVQSIITLALSGRVADPWRYMSGATPFNGDLCQAEHLCIDDKAGSFDIRKRLAFGTAIKDVSAVTMTSLHAKGCQAMTLRLYKRCTFSLNDEAENIMALPPMDDHLRDKVMLFKCERAEVEDDKTKVWRRIVKELPGFLHWVDNTGCPKALADSRYGVKAFAHPDLLEALEGFSPERRMNDLIDDIIFEDSRVKEFEGTAEALEKQLRNSPFHFAIDNLLKFPTACGVYLARLRKHFPDRFTSRKVSGRTIWTITKRKTEGLF
jgi:hypothetical protein